MSLMAVEADRGRGWISDRLLIDFGFYEPCQVSQRLLPAEIPGLRGMASGLCPAELCSCGEAYQFEAVETDPIVVGSRLYKIAHSGH
jgi:hypothetical protein